MNILLIPYNYILSADIRKSIKLKFKNSIIVFDEAHNVENFAKQVCTSELSFNNLNETKTILL